MTWLQRRLRWLTFFIALSGLAATSALAASAADFGPAAVIVEPDRSIYSLDGHLALLPDPSGKLTLEGVRSEAHADAFVTTGTATPNLGFERSVYWVRLRIDNRLSNAANYYLDLAYPLLDSVNAYIVSPGGVIEYQTGDRLPFGARPVMTRTFLFPLPLQPSQSVTVYLRVETVGSLNLPLDLLSRNAAFERITVQNGMLALYYGALLMLVIYNLYHFWRLKDVNAVYYAVFIAAYIAFQLALNGISFQFFWPNNPWWANVSLPFFLCAAYFAGVHFSTSILDTATNAPAIHRLLRALRWLAFVGMALALLGPYDIALRFSVALVFTVVLFIAAGLKISLEGYRPAQYYSWAWAVFLGGMIIYALKVFGVLPTNFFTSWVTQFGSVWQAVILAFMISDRFYLNEERRRAMQASYALDLERSVQEKTQALSQTNQRLLEQAEVLRRAERKADAANRAKSEFLANMSHEIRTPMNAIVGFLHLLSDSKLGQTQRDYVGKAESAARALMHLIRDLLDFSKIDVGRLELDAAPFEVAALVTEAQDLIALSARDKGLTLKVEQETAQGCWITGDQARLRQVLLNLLHNAVKFTAAGEVRLAVSCDAVGNGSVRVAIAVSDTGIGIDEEQRKGLFLPFTQADASITRRFGGTGLGLSISQRLVQQMGGEIALESRLGEGSRFSFSLLLPAAQPGARREPSSLERAPQARPLNGMRVLVVEDQPLNQEVVAALLQRSGAQPLIAPSGAAALALLRARAQVDAVLMDLQMPEMDGYETAERIHAMPEYASLPIIAVTAHVGASERDRCRAFGFEGHLAKPVDHRLLLRSLQRVREPAGFGEGASGDRGELFAAAAGSGECPRKAAVALGELGPGLSRPDDDIGVHCGRLRRFAERFGDASAIIRARLEAGNRSDAVAAAHTLSGVALTLGMPQVGMAARRIEQSREALSDGTFAALESAMRDVLASIAALDAEPDTAARAAGEQSEQQASQPLGRAALKAELLRLEPLLAGRNLRARAEVEGLVKRASDPDLRPLLDALGERVRRFDFDRGRARLGELLELLEAEGGR